MQEGKQIQSVAKAMQLLNLLAASPTPVGLAEISARTGWPKSTIHGLFATLREFSAVRQDGEGRYMLGVRLFEYGCALSRSWTILDIAGPYVQHIAYEIGEPVFLAILDWGEVITLARVERQAGLPTMAEMGCRLPVHCTAQGKLFLAYQPEEERNRMLKPSGFYAYTDHTITDPIALQKELERIRTQGYAIENGEYQVGLRAVAAPIFQKTGEVRYAIGTVGMFRQIESEQFSRAVAIVRETAQKFSKAL